jgi:hypothetical protein
LLLVVELEPVVYELRRHAGLAEAHFNLDYHALCNSW